MIRLRLSLQVIFAEGAISSTPQKNGITIFSSPGDVERENYPEEVFEQLFETESKSFWFIVRNRIISQMMKRYLPSPAKIMDVGCGTGFVASEIKKQGYTVDCGDVFPRALSFCRRRDAGTSYFQVNLEEEIFVDEYDGVCAFDVLEHLDHDRVALDTLHRLLKEGGYAFITVPAFPFLWSDEDRMAGHKRRYTSRDLKEKVKQSGFTVCKMTYFMTLLFPALVIRRRCHGTSSPDKDSDGKDKNRCISEIKPNRLVNSLLYGVFRIEPFLLSRMNLPFGGSLICVAKKNKR